MDKVAIVAHDFWMSLIDTPFDTHDARLKEVKLELDRVKVQAQSYADQLAEQVRTSQVLREALKKTEDVLLSYHDLADAAQQVIGEVSAKLGVKDPFPGLRRAVERVAKK